VIHPYDKVLDLGDWANQLTGRMIDRGLRRKDERHQRRKGHTPEWYPVGDEVNGGYWRCRICDKGTAWE
jgi:hypothetical protein